MFWDIFTLSFCFAVLLMLWSWLRIDDDNYTHILAAFASAVLFILIGLDSFGGVSMDYVMNNGTVDLLTTQEYTQPQVSLFLVIFGAIMLIYAVVLAFDVVSNYTTKIKL